MHEKIQKLCERLPGLAIDASDAACAPFLRDASGLEGERPLAVVRPKDAADVKPLVEAARAIGIGLVPVSSGGEHHRGDTLCAPETVVVDLRSLSRIVRIDRRNRVFLAEAGVTFADLVPALAAKGLRPMLPLGPRPEKSVLGAYLEREPTIHPRFQWDMSDPLLCTEVVFGTGELFRTGSAAGPGTLEEQWLAGDAQKNPMGPGQSDLVRLLQGAQGTIGIVTWCSAKCELLPARETLHLAAAPSLAALAPLVRHLLRRGHADVLFLADARALAALLADDREDFVRARAAAAPWNLVFSVSDGAWFPDERRAFVMRELREALAAAGLAPAAATPYGTLEDLHTRVTRPDLGRGRAWWKKAGLAATREIFFQTTLDRAERLLAAAEDVLATSGISRDDVLTTVQPQLGGRVCHVEIDLAFDEENAARVMTAFSALARALKAAGAFFSRPYGPLVEVAFDGASTAPLVPRIQRLFDPDRILSPGRLRVPERLLQDGGLHAVQ
ncbi:MAG: FAD-binding oxidoreductase [Deltaproteobacteria bacterium]|nr:FAD-binding oxidoreductase [Deltaproteobacteria bacterium]